MDGSDQARYDALMAKVDELGQVYARLTRENAELRDRVSRMSPSQVMTRTVRSDPGPAGPGAAGPGSAPGDSTGEPGDGRSISRRKVGKALGAVAASAVSAGALIEMAQPAAAANGNSVTAGNVTKGRARAGRSGEQHERPRRDVHRQHGGPDPARPGNPGQPSPGGQGGRPVRGQVGPAVVLQGQRDHGHLGAGRVAPGRGWPAPAAGSPVRRPPRRAAARYGGRLAGTA